MKLSEPYHEVAGVDIELPPERVRELLADPSIAQAIDKRFPTGLSPEIRVEDDRILLKGVDGHLEIGFHIEPRAHGCHLVAMETVQPTHALEAGKLALLPGRAHDEWESELKRLKLLLESFGRH